MNKLFTRHTLPAVLAVVFTILFFVLNHVCSYIDGTSGHLSLSFEISFMVAPLYLILILFLAIWAIINVCISFWRIRKFSQESIMSVVVFIIIAASPFAALFITSPGTETFLRGYKHWALKRVDIDMIQDWMEEAPDLYWIESDTYSSNEGKPDVLPECLKDWEFQYVSFEKYDLDGSKVVRLEWGGPFSHYGVVVGPPQMKMPDKTKHEFRKTIKPGAYVYEGS